MDPRRPALSEPWYVERSNGWFLQASDGAILVEVPLEQVADMPEGWKRSELVGPPPAFSLVERLWDEQAVESYSAVEIPEIEEVLSACGSCDGSGIFECNCPKCDEEVHACEGCDGEGAYACLDPEEITLHGVRFAADRARIIAQLPSFELGWPLQPGSGAPFVFGPGGRGIWQPLREKKGGGS